jgi:aminoglycoside/choline kinase family phosphotransferase
MKALILAAGLGTRLRPYSAATPKPLFPVAGEALLGMHVRRLAAAGCEAVAVNTHHGHDRVGAYLATQSFGIPVVLRHEPVLLGTGGAIKNLADFWDERPFFVVNADVFSDFDLGAVWDFHGRRSPAGTLVLTDDPDFNSVVCSPDGRIREFAGPRAAGSLTFTGIQVLDPVVLAHIPAGRFVHSIDVFRAMIAAGFRFEAFVPRQGAWSDIGTPGRYRRVAAEAGARKAWRIAFGEEPPAPLLREPLAGDGSDRRWYRLKGAGRSLIMADHHLRRSPERAEVDAFLDIGRHLQGRGLAVPAIHFGDPFAGLVFLQDLGDVNLQAAVRGARDRRRVLEWYRTVIAQVIALSIEGVKGFDPAWTYQTPVYSPELVLERECRYFLEAFLKAVAGLDIGFADLAEEFGEIAANAAAAGAPGPGFMHRDMQSRNILLAGGRFFFIDFQGGRLGPVQYDLASLLIDPYVDLAAEEQEALLDHALRLAAGRGPLDPSDFRKGYEACALARNLQVLGAFGFLSREKGKPRFADYIPTALQSLCRRLQAWGGAGYPKLTAAVERAVERVGSLPNPHTQGG